MFQTIVLPELTNTVSALAAPCLWHAAVHLGVVENGAAGIEEQQGSTHV
jgi:hypothetical protein